MNYDNFWCWCLIQIRDLLPGSESPGYLQICPWILLSFLTFNNVISTLRPAELSACLRPFLSLPFHFSLCLTINKWCRYGRYINSPGSGLTGHEFSRYFSVISCRFIRKIIPCLVFLPDNFWEYLVYKTPPLPDRGFGNWFSFSVFNIWKHEDCT
jgi:hypothetical protein